MLGRELSPFAIDDLHQGLGIAAAMNVIQLLLDFIIVCSIQEPRCLIVLRPDPCGKLIKRFFGSLRGCWGGNRTNGLLWNRNRLNGNGLRALNDIDRLNRCRWRLDGSLRLNL